MEKETGKMKNIKDKINDCPHKHHKLFRGNYCAVTNSKCKYGQKEECHLYNRYADGGFKI